MKHYRDSESGNIIFFIFIGVALFAALNLTVGNMMRGGDASMISEEKAKLYAGEVLTYARRIRQAVQDVRISNGCEDTQISFSNTTLAGYAHSPVSDADCQIFNTKGGAINYLAPQSDWLDSLQSAKNAFGELYIPEKACVDDVGTGSENCHSSGDDTGDLTLVIPYINQQICAQINNILGYSSTIDENSEACWSDGAFTKFTGTYDETLRLGNVANDGRTSQCVQCTSGNTGYYFYQVLLAR